jgi:hypothetical protein
MRVHHLVAAANVAGDGSILDPGEVRHGALRGGRVAALAAPVDPLTHLNRDFPDHQANVCVVVARLAVGARVLFEGDGFRLAWVRPSSFARRGSVAVGARREQFHRKLEAVRATGEQFGEASDGRLMAGDFRGY